MSKYDLLWEYVVKNNENELTVTFSDVERICGIPLDHSFLTCKKELERKGFSVKKISMKQKTILIVKNI